MMHAGEVDQGEIALLRPGGAALHWLVAGLAVVVVSLGLAIPGAPRESESRELLLLLHRSVGLLILALMCFGRVGGSPIRRPAAAAEFPWIEALAAHADHYLLYLLFLVMPLSGYLMPPPPGIVSFFGLVANFRRWCPRTILSQAATRCTSSASS